MGRELRRVPPNWNHPLGETGHFQPMHDERFGDRFAQWLADFDRIRSGNLTDIERECYGKGIPLANWLNDEGSPRDPKYYRPWSDDEATWYQVWETVSEGTPVTPPFATKEELVSYLVEHGDFWQQRRYRDGSFMQPNPPGYSREAAERFVNTGWAPSMIVSNGQVAEGINSLRLLDDEKSP